MKRPLPSWIQKWVLVGSVFLIVDAAFILLRPDSFTSGIYGKYFMPWNLYMEVDKSYGDLNSPSIKARAYMGLLEVSLALLGVWLYSRKSMKGNFLIYTATIMSLSKMLFQFMMEVTANFVNVRHNSSYTFTTVYLLANGLLMILPIFMAFAISSSLGLGKLMTDSHVPSRSMKPLMSPKSDTPSKISPRKKTKKHDTSKSTPPTKKVSFSTSDSTIEASSRSNLPSSPIQPKDTSSASPVVPKRRGRPKITSP